jgi:hypothetical protein
LLRRLEADQAELASAAASDDLLATAWFSESASVESSR